MKGIPSVVLYSVILSHIVLLIEASGQRGVFRNSKKQTEDEAFSSVIGHKERSGTSFEKLTLTSDSFSSPSRPTAEDLDEAAKFSAAVVERFSYKHTAKSDSQQQADISSKELPACKVTNGEDTIVYYIDKSEGSLQFDELQCGDERWLFDPFTDDFMYVKGLEEEIYLERQGLLAKTLAKLSGVPTSSLRVTAAFCGVTLVKLQSLSKAMGFDSVFSGVCLGHRKTMEQVPRMKFTLSPGRRATNPQPNKLILRVGGFSSESPAVEGLTKRVEPFESEVKRRAVYKYRDLQEGVPRTDMAHVNVAECRVTHDQYGISFTINEDRDMLKLSELKCGVNTYSYDIFDEVLFRETTHCEPNIDRRVYVNGAGRPSSFLAHVENGIDMSDQFCAEASVKLNQLSRAMGYENIFFLQCPPHFAFATPIIENIKTDMRNSRHMCLAQKKRFVP
ncbi:hypothetical protein FOL47_007065 [Perkinsus chesapeaki]|uniref:Uncharacterized protein n=1 Tax=Perkinsus chesapeaki TaxID=330153 RepID=A0A7J6LN69_PERCH|nr:hypothetical protein FOL47_007065 [Perkinsus chesapeaki]